MSIKGNLIYWWINFCHLTTTFGSKGLDIIFETGRYSEITRENKKTKLHWIKMFPLKAFSYSFNQLDVYLPWAVSFGAVLPINDPRAEEDLRLSTGNLNWAGNKWTDIWTDITDSCCLLFAYFFENDQIALFLSSGGLPWGIQVMLSLSSLYPGAQKHT